MIIDSMLICLPLFHTITEMHISDRNRKKGDGDCDENCVLHKSSSESQFLGRLIGRQMHRLQFESFLQAGSLPLPRHAISKFRKQLGYCWSHLA